ncbi:MAG: L-ribulose-5-phosphate 3-epimerase [Clostridiaceae bacterium]|jgi:L-ribulose-5-phosphate 3-epimerase|nr:L-ribulose-5-phosphate 3-epimerase [Clostridiaceae bacterium]
MTAYKRKNPLGIYEKAFPSEYTWEQILRGAKEAGYDFVEMSIDESAGRLSRLDWSAEERGHLRQLIHDTGVGIWAIGLSAHRKYPLGSASDETRKQGLEILGKVIKLAVDLGVRVIQVMGYDAFYEPSDENTHRRFREGLRTGLDWASAAGVILALENVDTDLVNSAEKAMSFVNEFNSPWFQIYPDVGNMKAFGYDPLEQLKLTEGHLVGVHVKDTRPGELRGVPLGAGTVPIRESFQQLAKAGYAGPILMEMWADFGEAQDPLDSIVQARVVLDRWMKEAWGD